MPHFHIQLFSIITISLLLASCQKDNSLIELFDLVIAKKNWNSQKHIWKESELRILENGRKLYKKNCGGCHGSTGQGDNFIGAPALKNNSIVKGEVELHIKIVLQGKPTRSMPAYNKILDDQSLAAILSYERNAWGNNTFEIISAQQVQQQR